MKSFILSCLLLLTNFSCFAYYTHKADTVIMKISNDTGYDCVATKYFVLNGRISDRIYFQEVILRDQTMTFSMNSEGDQTERKAIVIGYKCGDDQNVTFLTDVNEADEMYVTYGRVISSQHIHAHFEEEYNKSWYYDASPIVLHWTFYRSSH